MDPVVSIIIPVYNKQDYIRETIDSVLIQDFDNFEIIVVDDGSTDSSLEVVRSFNDQRLQVFSQSNTGVERARNFGFSKSFGSLIIFLDADDLMSKDRLRKQIERFGSNQELSLLGTWANVIDNSGKVIGSICPPVLNGALQLAHLFRNQFVCSSVMIRRSAIDGGIIFDESRGARFAEDYDLWFRVSKNAVVANIPEKLTSYRRLNSSRSQSRDGSLFESARSISAEWLFLNTNHFTTLESAHAFVLSVNGLDDLSPNHGCNMTKMFRTYTALLEDLRLIDINKRSQGVGSVIFRHKVHFVAWSVIGIIPVPIQRKMFALLRSIKSSRLTKLLLAFLPQIRSRSDSVFPKGTFRR